MDSCPDATSFNRSTSTSSRIDAVFVNSVLRPLLGEAGVVLDSSFPIHKPFAVELRVDACEHSVMTCKRPRPISLLFTDPHIDAEAAISDRVYREVFASLAIDGMKLVLESMLRHCGEHGTTLHKIICVRVLVLQVVKWMNVFVLDMVMSSLLNVHH